MLLWMLPMKQSRYCLTELYQERTKNMQLGEDNEEQLE